MAQKKKRRLDARKRRRPLRDLRDLQHTEPVEVAELGPTQQWQHKMVVEAWARRDKREAEIKAEKRRDRATRRHSARS